MYGMIVILFALVLCGAPAKTLELAEMKQIQQPAQSQPLTQNLPAPRVCRGVKLGMIREEVSGVMRPSAREGGDWEEFKLDGGDLMTVRYDSQDIVKIIQLYFTHAAHAPKWTEVVGDVQIQSKPGGSKYAHVVNKEENLRVTMFQSKSGAITAITLSR